MLDIRYVEHQNRRRLKQTPVNLSLEERAIVHNTIVQHCPIRDWTLPALNVRTNHVHLVVTADASPEAIMSQLEAWCSRRLSEHAEDDADARQTRRRWWTRHGSPTWINDDQYLRKAIQYVKDGQ